MQPPRCIVLPALLWGYGMRSDMTFNGSQFAILLPAPASSLPA